MTPEPAVAATSGLAGPSGPPDLETRLGRLLAAACGGESGPLGERLLPAPSSVRHPAAADGGFYWLLIPRWLAGRFGLTASTAGRELLADLLWIQYCVYGVFRVQDDLVDGDSGDARLAVQANHLLAEAARCAAGRFAGGSPFWRVFSATIDATSRTIVRLAERQRHPDREPGEDRRLYAELSACLKIATAGVALASGRERAWRRRLSPALDHLAIASQILDDLRDLREDLRDGRLNYAACHLARPVFGASAEATEAVIASNLATSDRLQRLVEEIAGDVDDALRSLGPDLCPATYRYVTAYRDGVLGLGERMGRSRAELWRVDPERADGASAATP